MVAGSNPVSLAMVVVAQLAEHRIVVSRVMGSNPISHPCGGDGVKRGAQMPFTVSRHLRGSQTQTSEPLGEDMSKSKITIEINAKPAWKASRGHAAYRGGAGIMGDRRTKRNRTRATKKNRAIREFL